MWKKSLGSLTTAKGKVTQQADKLGLPTPSQPYSPIRADIENYLHNTYAWQLSPERIAQEFRDVLYDPAADAGIVRRELERLSRNDFVQYTATTGPAYPSPNSAHCRSVRNCP
ncbi:hypothetical protein ANSO36C_28170 [Nostoc cf. commune SO-36]|uniref:Uncharacterized protein n=1 Tax=Nostoc cf. commune SO-36 TaxID=449208 RepID=A0ABM7Z203_NOSCO|nr:hypothetical protein ANSO36C_28170 [Nostoc cf. commune SO-36]